jgi:phosphoribosylglycinamide formyltransferase-1
MTQPLRLAVLLSGGGTTLQNLLDRVAEGSLPARVEVVLSSNPRAYGLERARLAGISHEVVTPRDYRSPAELGSRLFELCRQAQADLVCLAGFLHLLEIPPDYWPRVMNIHPSLIPAFCGQGFYGKRVHQAVLDAGVKVSGCTVHFVDNEYDHGPIILQKAVAVEEEDTVDTLAQRVFAAECLAYPEAIRLFAQNRLEVKGRKVHIVVSGE